MDRPPRLRPGWYQLLLHSGALIQRLMVLTEPLEEHVDPPISMDDVVDLLNALVGDQGPAA